MCALATRVVEILGPTNGPGQRRKRERERIEVEVESFFGVIRPQPLANNRRMSIGGELELSIIMIGALNRRRRRRRCSLDRPHS